MKTVKLSQQSKAISREIHREWKLTQLEETYLNQALRELDKAVYCESQAWAEGFSLEDKAGRKYLNPLLIQAKICRNNYLRLMKLVGFEVALKAKKRKIGRPTASETYGKEVGDADPD